MRSTIFGLALALAAATAFAAPPAKRPADDAFSMGNPKARIVLEEYASLSCTHCAHFNNEVFPAFKKKYIDTGRVRFTLREFLTPPENVAGVGFITARCAGPKRYFSVVDDFFHRQATIYETHDLAKPLLALGQKFGLTEAAINKCLEDPAAGAALNARVQAGIDRGVNSTPSFYINGVKAPDDTQTLAQLDQLILAATKAGK